MYFNAPYTESNIKKQYRELSKKLHPDKGGNADNFNLMQHEYNALQKQIKISGENIHPIVKRSAKSKKRGKIKKVRIVKVIIIDPEEIINKFIKKIIKW
jgi:hypothetical protein